jgi:uncharacterized Rmd1/YagE family protein
MAKTKTKSTSPKLFGDQGRVRVRALLAGQRLNLKAFEIAPKVASSPLVVNTGQDGYAVLFRYGVVVLFNVAPVEEVSFLAALQTVIQEPFEKTEFDEAEIIIDPKIEEQVEDTFIAVNECRVEHLQVIADVLAKSVTLSWYEYTVADSFGRVEQMADELKRKGRSGRKARELLSHIGASLLIQSQVIGRVEVEDKPDILWDRPDLERLYMQLESQYELLERHAVLKHKLDLIHQTAETMLGLLTDKRTLHVEWYIVILIVFEIVLSLWDRFTGVAH